MPRRLTPVKWHLLVRFFEAHGFERERTKGSHLSMVKPGVLRPLVIQMCEVSVSNVMSNLRTAGLSRQALLDWLDTQ